MYLKNYSVSRYNYWPYSILDQFSNTGARRTQRTTADTATISYRLGLFLVFVGKKRPSSPGPIDFQSIKSAAGIPKLLSSKCLQKGLFFCIHPIIPAIRQRKAENHRTHSTSWYWISKF